VVGIVAARKGAKGARVEALAALRMRAARSRHGATNPPDGTKRNVTERCCDCCCWCVWARRCPCECGWVRGAMDVSCLLRSFSVVRNTLPGGAAPGQQGFFDAAALEAARDVDAKWPAFAWDAPANYHQYGRWFSDQWATPRDVPHWYNQPDGGHLTRHSAGFLQPHLYGPLQAQQPAHPPPGLVLPRPVL